MRQELEQLLDTHRAQRPEMQPQDYYKLLYQREFGCGHTAPAPETAERHLMEEYARAAGLPGADAVPEGHYEAENMKSTVVPFRNGIMLSVACGLAESRKLSKVLIANHGGDHAIYPDCRAGFVHSMSEAMRHGMIYDA